LDLAIILPRFITLTNNSKVGILIRFLHGAIVLCLICTLAVPTPAVAIDDPLIMGVFPRRNVKLTHQMFTPLANYLSQELGREVRLRTSKDFKSFWSDLHQKEFDLVHFNQYHYVVANEKLGYEAIVKNVEFGENTLAGSIMVRSDSGIKSIKELRGKKVLFGGGPRAMVSYIIPTYMLRMAGLEKGDYIEAFSKNPPNAILATYHKQADAAGIGAVVSRLKMVTQTIDITEMEYLVKSEPLPHLPWAVKESMPQKTKANIQKTMIGLKNNLSGQAVLDSMELSDLQSVDDSAYNRHRAIINKVYPDGGP
jgi:phosphonate transport system substrate-binding protein